MGFSEDTPGMYSAGLFVDFSEDTLGGTLSGLLWGWALHGYSAELSAGFCGSVHLSVGFIDSLRGCSGTIQRHECENVVNTPKTLKLFC